MKKQLQLFFAPDDEIELSKCLKVEIPGISFLDDNVWSGSPDYRQGVEDCDTGRTYLYSGQRAKLPTAPRKNGEIEGPIAGCVVQMLRATEQEGVLFSGRVAAGISDDDKAMRDFVDKVWKCVRSVGKVGVVRPDGRTDKNYIVGHHALRLIAVGKLRIADKLIGMHYEPVV